MIRRNFMRTAIAAAGFATLAGCVVNLGFAIQKQVTVQSPSGVTAVSQTIAVDLLNSKEVADHKGAVRSLDLEYADITVVALGVGNSATRLNTGTLKLRKDAADMTHDVLVGDLTNFALTVGNTARLQGSPPLDAFLLDALHGDGKFLAVVDGSVDAAPVNVTLDLDLHASIGYDAGIL